MKAIAQITLPALLCMSSFWTSGSQAQDITFTKIVDTDTPIPGGVGNFTCTNRQGPTISGGTTGFKANGAPGYFGYFTSMDGIVSTVLDTNTIVPNSGGETFAGGGITDFPSYDRGTFGFWGSGFTQQGVYTTSGGPIAVVADRNTPIPGGVGNFVLFGNLVSSPDFHDGSTVFYGTGFAPTQEGIYTDIGGALSVVADLDTAIPDGTGTFGPTGGGSAVFGVPSVHQGTIVFAGRGAGQFGLYRMVNGVLGTVADTTTPLPGATSNLGGVSRVDVHDGEIAFIATTPHGIYVESNGSIRLVANLDTAIPEGSGNFGAFAEVALDHGNVAFWAANANGSQQGIYTDVGGSLIKVIDLTDTLDGKTLSTFRTGDGSLSGRRIAFCAFFSDSSNGVYVAELPGGLPPTAVAGNNQSIHVGQTVFLDGTDSFDDDTATADLVFSWTFDTLPPGSNAAFDDPASPTPSFVADQTGTYVVQLVVTDQSGQSSPPDTVEVSSLNARPTAAAGDDQIALVNTAVFFDGSESSDADGDPLAFSWALLAQPDGSAAALTGAATSVASLVPDLPGSYTVELVVNDGFENSLADQATLTAIAGTDFALILLMDASNFVNALADETFGKPGHRDKINKRLAKIVEKIQQAAELEAESKSDRARTKLDNATRKLDKLIRRTDGCALRGAPDPKGDDPVFKPDWLVECGAQQTLYDLLVQVRGAINP